MLSATNLHVVVAGDDRIATVTVQNMNLGAAVVEGAKVVGFKTFAFSWAGQLWGASSFFSVQTCIYFTRPYVISWGLFQAAACGSPLLVNRFGY